LAEYVDSNGDPVPEVQFEAYIETGFGNVVHVRVTGNRWEFTTLLSRFTQLCQQHQSSMKGYTSGY
jgi:hypothetical protein